MTSSLPFSLRQALEKLSIEPGEVLFSFCSNAAPDGNLGESWFLFLDSTLSLIMVTPLLEEIQLQNRFFVKAVKEIEARRSFLGNLHLAFMGGDGQRVGEFVVPGLQQNLWESLLTALEKRFPGKLKEDEELLKQRLGDVVDPDTGLPSILSSAQSFGGNLGAMSDGRISVSGTPRALGEDLSVHTSKDFTHRASAAQIVSGPASLTPIIGVEVDPLTISSGMGISGLDQSMIDSGTTFDQPISIEIDDRSSGIQLPDLSSDVSSVIGAEQPQDHDRRSAPEAVPGNRSPSGKKKKFKNAGQGSGTHPDQRERKAASSTEETAEGDFRCSTCGRQNKADYFYCLGCGAQLLKLPKESAPPAAPPTRPGKRMTPKVSFGASTAQEPSGEGLISGCLSQLFMILVMMAGIFILLGLFS